MNSRMERHYELNKSNSNRRTFRNQDLYKSIYEDMEYTNVEGITSIGRANDIDISKIKELIKSREEYKKERDSIINKDSISKISNEMNVIDEEVYDERNYDIRDILIKAKTERQSTDDKKRSLDNEKYNILKKLEISHENNQVSLKEIEKEENELKELLHTLTNTALIKKMDDKDLSIDLFEELKGTGNTEVVGTSTSINAVMREVASSQTEEDDDDEDGKLDNSFYTGNVGLSPEDFDDLKEVGESMKKNNVLILAVLGVLFLFLLFIAIHFGQA